MALSITQMQTVSYPAVLNESGKAANQFSENALLREMKRQGGIVTEEFGTVLEHSLDYRRNPGSDFMATDMTGVSLAKTEVLTAAQYDIASLVTPINWTFQDEIKNASENAKIKLVTSLLTNALESHDAEIEEALFATTTDGFLGMETIIPDGGQGTVGGIDASVETWWRNYTATYASAGTNIQAQMTKAFNNAQKGSGGSAPNLIVSGADAQGIFEGTLHALVRYQDSEDAKLGFKTLGFKTGRYVFSPSGGTDIRFINTKFTKLRMAKGASRSLKDAIELSSQTGYTRKLFTMLQFTTSNKSRNSVLTQV